MSVRNKISVKHNMPHLIVKQIFCEKKTINRNTDYKKNKVIESVIQNK